jgi:hypothetical protein
MEREDCERCEHLDLIGTMLVLATGPAHDVPPSLPSKSIPSERGSTAHVLPPRPNRSVPSGGPPSAVWRQLVKAETVGAHRVRSRLGRDPGDGPWPLRHQTTTVVAGADERALGSLQPVALIHRCRGTTSAEGAWTVWGDGPMMPLNAVFRVDRARARH